MKNSYGMSLKYLFYKIHKHFISSTIYTYGLYYILAAISTYILVKIGFDVWWYQFSESHPHIYRAGFASAILGLLIPVFVPLGMYIYGRILKKVKTQVTALALGQAGILGLVISSFIKVFTGRIPPEAFTNQTFGGFQFGFLRGGAFNGWPSSHTTVAFALAFTLMELYPDNTFIKTCAVLFACVIGLGVSLNIHWFSDIIAGVFIGYTIGKTVGKSFSESLK